MQERFKGDMLSPQFKDLDQDLSTQECRKFSTVSAIEINTPETKYRSTIGNRADLSKDANSLHFRNRTAKFEDDQQRNYQEIRDMFYHRQFDEPTLMEPKVQFKTEKFPSKIIIRRKQQGANTLSQFNDQALIDKIYQTNKLSLQNLLSHQF